MLEWKVTHNNEAFKKDREGKDVEYLLLAHLAAKFKFSRNLMDYVPLIAYECTRHLGVADEGISDNIDHILAQHSRNLIQLVPLIAYECSSDLGVANEGISDNIDHVLAQLSRNWIDFVPVIAYECTSHLGVSNEGISDNIDHILAQLGVMGNARGG